jgi:hypothetical protein
MPVDSMLSSNAVAEVPYTPRPTTSQSRKTSIANCTGRTSKYFKARLTCAKALTPEVVILAQCRNFKVERLAQ